MPTYVDGKGVRPLIRGINAGAARAIRLHMIYTFDKLQAAWHEEIHGKHEQENQARYEYLREYLREYRLMTLKDDLIAHTYEPSPLRNKQIYIPKRRVAQVPGLEDKIVQRLICKECVYDNLTKPLIRDTYACIRGRGTSDADKRLKLQLHHYWNKYKTPPYILKCDIHSYFATIDHVRLSTLIDRYITDTDVREIVYKFLNLTDIGLPLGLEQNQLLANQLAEGEIEMDKAEVCYRAWRQHANEGDCRNLILAMDEKFRRELQKYGYDMRIEPYYKNNKRKERVKIFVKNTE